MANYQYRVRWNYAWEPFAALISAEEFFNRREEELKDKPHTPAIIERQEIRDWELVPFGAKE